MATRKRKKRSWLKRLLFYILFPLVVWFIAFLLWFYWRDLTALLANHEPAARPAANAIRREHGEAQTAKRPGEKILDEDRKKLEDIIKRRTP